MNLSPEHKEAYRQLLYDALVNMRAGNRRPVLWNPLSWWRLARQAASVRDHADAFHNLALFSWLDFQGFDPDRFWQDIAGFAQKHGHEWMRTYQRAFKEHLADASIKRGGWTCS